MIVVVTGQPIRLAVDPCETILDIRRRAVAAAGYDDGAYWEVRDAGGSLLDQTALVVRVVQPEDRLFANLPAGIGA